VPLNLSIDDYRAATGIALASILVLLGHAGFALYETGLSRAKNASNAMAMNALVWALCAIGFFVTGFALMYGGAAPSLGLDRWLIHLGAWKILTGKGFFLDGISGNPGVLLLFFGMLCRVTIAATIPSGALAERWKFKSFFVFAVLIGAVIVPIYGSWVWGGGWIAQLGTGFGWGHGGIDYAGSSIIHLQAGGIGLVTAWMLGPRQGKFDTRGRPRPILGHHIPMAVLGCLIISIALLSLNILPSLVNSDGRVIIVATNSVLAAAAGAVAACLCTIWGFGKPEPTMMCNGILASLVAIAAPSAFVEPWSAVLIGAVAGAIVIWSVSFWEARGIDDPCGVVSVHGISGLWGILALGLFADGSFGQGYNGVNTHAVAGLFYGDTRQLLAQCVMAIACVAWSCIAGGLAFGFVGRFFGPNRVPRDVELSGLDITEVGVPAYRELLSPSSATTVFSAEPRPAAAPAGVGKPRYSVVIEGVDSATLIKAWSGLCQIGSEPPSAEFKEIYPILTTVTGNRFRFTGGDPLSVKESLRRLLQAVLPDRSVSTRIES
jgi:ammonium transporter, Amt family